MILFAQNKIQGVKKKINFVGQNSFCHRNTNGNSN